MTKISVELPIMFFGDQPSLEMWLENNHDESSGIRLQIAKKQSGISSVSYAEALESALCYGWVDSRKETFDDTMWLQRFTPRKTRSIWSKVNKEKAELLIADGKMKPAGFNAIEIAKKNGEWDKAYAPQSSASLPEDFAILLNQNHKAKAFYETLDKTNKYAITFRLNNVKKQETREKRIQQYLLMLENGEKIYP